MTKPDEIALLQKTVRAFGLHSYLGPFLAAHEAKIIGDIINDLAIDLPMPKDARREAFETLEEARKESGDLISTARKDADTIIGNARDKAQRDADQIRARLRHALETAAKAL